MKNILRLAIIFATAGSSALFGFLYYDHNVKWRQCFNSMDRCFDEQAGVVYHKQSGGVFLGLAVLMACIALYQLWRLRR